MTNPFAFQYTSKTLLLTNQVTWVSAWDAAAYCAWQGARLPHSWEWQWIAQVGVDS